MVCRKEKLEPTTVDFTRESPACYAVGRGFESRLSLAIIVQIPSLQEFPDYQTTRPAHQSIRALRIMLYERNFMNRICVLGSLLLLTGCNAMSGIMADAPVASVPPAMAAEAQPATTSAPGLTDLDCRPGRAGSSDISCE